MPDFDYTAIIGVMKQAALGAVAGLDLFAYLDGTVSGTDPLKIKVDQKLELEEKQLIMTNAVRDHYIKLEAYDSHKEEKDYHVTEKQNQGHMHQFTDATPGGPVLSITQTQSQEKDHDHKYKGGVFKICLGLKKDEKVHLLQIQGGQHFIVLDRVDPPKGEEGGD